MQLEELTDKAIDHIFANVTVEGLSKWEANFVESLNDQWTRRRKLSDKQKIILGQIWDKQP